MNLSQLSIRFTNDRNTFFVMRKQNPEKFNYIMSFDDNNVYSVQKYIKHIEDMLKKVTDFYYTFEDDKDFGSWLVEKGIIKKRHQRQWFVEALFAYRDNFFRMRFRFVKTLEKVASLI